MENMVVFPEAPLQEEPMPEQKSFKNKSPKQKMQYPIRSNEIRQSIKRNNAVAQAFDPRASNDFNMVTHDMLLK